MSWGTEKGWDFRHTGPFVTDPTNNIYVIDSITYPTTTTIGGDSVTYGISAGVAGTNYISLDQDSTVTDKRLAGIDYAPPATSFEFRVDLPAAGNYNLRLANGSTGTDFSAYRQVIKVYDGAGGLLYTLDKGTGPGQDNYYDANGTLLSEANWPGSNTPVALTFANTYARIVIGDAVAGYTALAHLSLEQLGGGGGAPVLGSFSPNNAYSNPTVPVKLIGVSVTGTGLDGTGGAFTPPSGFTVSNLSVAGGGASATFDLQIATGKSPGSYNFTYTTSGGSSSGTSNTLAFVINNPSGGGGLVDGLANLRGGFES